MAAAAILDFVKISITPDWIKWHRKQYMSEGAHGERGNASL